jgi:hypothetical protein
MAAASRWYLAMPDQPEGIGVSGDLPGVRTMVLVSYSVGADLYAGKYNGEQHPKGSKSIVLHLKDLFSLICYGSEYPHTGRKAKKTMDVDVMVKRWHKVVLGLAMAHDKDEADRYEGNIDECLAPILTAPVRQIREFGKKLAESLKNDPKVPFLVWTSYQIWMNDMLQKAEDEAVIALKTDLARDIAELVEQDVKDQIPEAITRALQWRDAERLQKVKEVVTAEKEAGRKVRLKGRESCLFIEAGGTEEVPAVRIQV